MKEKKTENKLIMTEDSQAFELYERAINELPPIKKNRKSNKNKFRVLPMFATFIAGAIVVASLSFAADYFNIFSENKVIATTDKVSTIYQGKLVQATNEANKESIATMYTQVSQAVVKIENYSKTKANSVFDPRQGLVYTEPQRDEMQLTGSGTGFIFEADGYILTNEHVIHGADQVLVSVPEYDEPFVAYVVNASEDLDIALLKIEPLGGERFSTVELGDSSLLDIGEWVMAIGNPYGYDYTLTMGVVSAKERPITLLNNDGEEQTFEHMLQTDASINPGNSGGPLLSEAGQVIGMNTAVNAEAQGIGFAIPINEIKLYLQSVESNIQL